MYINVLLTPTELPKSSENGERVAIVIDVLRASTTICIAFSSGVKAIIPSTSVEEATGIFQALPPSIRLLGGERRGVKQPGFDIGNSPLEYTPEIVNGKIISFTTSNGTNALQLVRAADSIYIGSFMNLQALSEYIADNHSQSNSEITIICAGSSGAFSLEDACCAGGYVGYLSSFIPTAQLSDSAVASESLFSNYRDNLLGFLQSTTHGKSLRELGFSDDIECAADLNSLEVVPKISGDSIISATLT
ncbi:MAG: 2-phosphosulfolactate phosphatase [Ignavibacteria bacterium]|nr:2-phosphosulfolactate phosphatase [Ignavibacteria bacterium]